MVKTKSFLKKNVFLTGCYNFVGLGLSVVIVFIISMEEKIVCLFDLRLHSENILNYILALCSPFLNLKHQVEFNKIKRDITSIAFFVFTFFAIVAWIHFFSIVATQDMPNQFFRIPGARNLTLAVFIFSAI